MTTTSLHPTEPNARQVLATRILWFSQTIFSSLAIAAVMLFVVPSMDLALPDLSFASREVMVGGVIALGLGCFVAAKALRERLYAPPLPAAVAASGDPVQRALAQINANSALVGGVLTAPFMVGVALHLVSQDEWLLAAGGWVPLLGGVMLRPDPLRDCRVLQQR